MRIGYNIALSVLSSCLPSVALADCSVPPPERLSLVIESCKKSEAEQIVEHLLLYQFGTKPSPGERNKAQEVAEELVESDIYKGIIVNAKSQAGSKPYFVPEGDCKYYPAGSTLDAGIGTACCDGDPNPPCYLGFSNFVIDNSLPSFSPIAASSISEWLAFQPGIELTHVRHNPNLYLAKPEPRLFFSDAYMNNFQTQTQLHIMLYPAGKMFEPNREAMLTGIEKQLAYARLNKEAMKGLFIGKVPRENARFTTYAYFGGGPGGESYGAFTELGNERYELLVQLRTFSKDAIPAEQRPEAWAKPSAELRNLMPNIEAHFLEQMK